MSARASDRGQGPAPRLPTLPAMSTGDDVLVQLCRDLRLLQAQAGGPSVRDLAATVGLGKSQVSAILGGRIRRPPDWRGGGGVVEGGSPDARGRDRGVVRGLVEALSGYAREHAGEHRLSIRWGREEYWRPRHAVVEHAAGRRLREPGELVPRQMPPRAPHFVGRDAELDALTRGTDPLLITGMAG